VLLHLLSVPGFAPQPHQAFKGTQHTPHTRDFEGSNMKITSAILTGSLIPWSALLSKWHGASYVRGGVGRGPSCSRSTSRIMQGGDEVKNGLLLRNTSRCLSTSKPFVQSTQRSPNRQEARESVDACDQVSARAPGSGWDRNPSPFFVPAPSPPRGILRNGIFSSLRSSHSPYPDTSSQVLDGKGGAYHQTLF